MDIPPNQTLYVNNLPEKIKKQELKQLLYALFGQFGKIIDVIAMRADKLRGQTWVVFADIASATSALRGMQGFPFYEKPIRVSFAISTSNAVAAMKGGKAKKSGKPPKAPKAAEGDEGTAAEKKAAAADRRAAADKAAAGGGTVGGVDVGKPGSKLFVEGLPAATTAAMLDMLFKQFPGCKEVTMIPSKPGVAFIEFETEMQASVALSGLQGFKITPQNAMTITYAK
ncbi:U2 small nuclear ribonucleo B -like isoform B [Micractinium conductrix]|uniref:U2 small nuclear ribonucleo B -like isoform B n=1 Tax=Micractinium conductrix TaxID=554055 RepID=A0A2P6V9H8_9CHLO|nr:U2 small nuclear ribonucleo B -like isoform B [Micractinium conductrix]|eukprot:PSC70739.1 U2 small nuclear ribonucleo B -like isoform B [Micractinium conductrix]